MSHPRASDARFLLTQAHIDEACKRHDEAQQRNSADEHDWAIIMATPGDEFVDVVCNDGWAVEGAGSSMWVDGLGGRKRGPPSCVPPGRMTWYDAC